MLLYSLLADSRLCSITALSRMLEPAGEKTFQHFRCDSIQISCKFFRLTISCGGFLVRHQHGCKLLQLVASDDTVQVHLLQDAIGGQLLTALILEEGGQHSGTLLAWKNKSSRYETDLFFTQQISCSTSSAFNLEARKQ